MNTKENKPKTKSKKDLIREIIEIDDRFDITSLSRTNITNLKLVRDLVLKVQPLARARLNSRPTPKTTGRYNNGYYVCFTTNRIYWSDYFTLCHLFGMANNRRNILYNVNDINLYRVRFHNSDRGIFLDNLYQIIMLGRCIFSPPIFTGEKNG